MIFVLVAVLAWAYLLLFHGRFWQTGPVLAPARPARMPAVAAVVPARDEAEVIDAAAASLAAQDVPLHVVVVDDGSSDATAAIARRHAAVIAGAPRPAGWAGKLWAVQQGIAATHEPWLLLTDADIVHEPDHLATLMAQAERTGADLVSEMVILNCTSAAERMLVPAFVYFFQLLYPFARVNDPHSRVAAAAGGTMLVRREALERIGGIAAIRGALIDDVTLATAIKRGGRVWLGHSGLARSIRPYPHAADIWRMIARSAYVQLRHSPAAAAGDAVRDGADFLDAVGRRAARCRRPTRARCGRVARNGGQLRADAAALPALAAARAAAAVHRDVLHGGDGRQRVRSSPRPRRGVEAPCV